MIVNMQLSDLFILLSEYNVLFAVHVKYGPIRLYLLRRRGNNLLKNRSLYKIVLKMHNIFYTGVSSSLVLGISNKF